MGKKPEWLLVCSLLFVFALVVGGFGYFLAGDKDAIAVAFVLMAIVAGVGLGKANQ